MLRPISTSALVALTIAAVLLPTRQVEGSPPVSSTGDADVHGDQDLAVANVQRENVSVLPDVADTETTPVIGSFFAVLTDAGEVLLRWTLDPGVVAEAINVYRAMGRYGTFTRINPEPLAPVSPGVYVDGTVWPGTSFWYELRAAFPGGGEMELAGSPAYVTTGGSLPTVLYPPHPNPSFGEARIEFDVPDHDETVDLAVYNVRGQLVTTLVRASLEPGPHGVDWDGADSRGSPVSGGVYFVRLRVGAEQRLRKVLMVR